MNIDEQKQLEQKGEAVIADLLSPMNSSYLSVHDDRKEKARAVQAVRHVYLKTALFAFLFSTGVAVIDYVQYLLTGKGNCLGNDTPSISCGVEQAANPLLFLFQNYLILIVGFTIVMCIGVAGYKYVIPHIGGKYDVNVPKPVLIFLTILLIIGVIYIVSGAWVTHK